MSKIRADKTGASPSVSPSLIMSFVSISCGGRDYSARDGDGPLGPLISTLGAGLHEMDGKGPALIICGIEYCVIEGLTVMKHTLARAQIEGDGPGVIHVSPSEGFLCLHIDSLKSGNLS